jgi:hypothetical protein
MAELAHDASNCLVCRAKVAAPRRIAQGMALFAAGLCITSGVLELKPAPARHRPAAVVAAKPVVTPKPVPAPKPVRHVAVDSAARTAAASALARNAAIGVGRPFFTSSSVFATADRVARWRPLVTRAARSAGIAPALLEAVVYVESSGRADSTNGSAVGLTQLRPAIARRLGLHVDARHANKLTRWIARTWNPKHERQLRRWRARYDERYAPLKELRASARYLAQAKQALGRDDLAIEAYHLGIPALRGASVSYAALYFRTARVDDYGFKVLAAQRIMRMYRGNASALRFEERQQARKNSAEEYLHPLARTHRFGTPDAILRAEQHRVLRMIPVDVSTTHVATRVGGEARKLGRSKRLYRALRPAALDVLLYIGREVHSLSHARKPLILTSAVRDLRYQRVLMRVNANAARSYSLHTTGYAFDIARSYANDRQGRAFQRVLDRLVAANAIAYIRESAAIHVAVAGDASEKLRLLAKVVG